MVAVSCECSEHSRSTTTEYVYMYVYMYVCMCIFRVYISTCLFTNLCVSTACFLTYIYVFTLMILGAWLAQAV
jgi:hypothetical protein